MPQTLPWNFRFEDVAPEIHVGGEKVGAQVLKELDAAHDMKHEVEGQRRHGRGGRIIAEHGKEHERSRLREIATVINVRAQ